MIKEIREYDTVHLFTAHNQPGSMAITPWPDESWLSVNNVYSYDSLIYMEYKSAYFQTPSGFRSFTPDSEGDMVLVIDNASLELPAPGE